MGRKINKILFELSSKSGYDFETYCIKLLDLACYNLSNSHTLGHFEKEGIDAYTTNENRSKYLIAYQFKGFEANEIGSSQKKQIKNSIKKFALREEKFEEFKLIVNIRLDKDNINDEFKEYFYSFAKNMDLKFSALNANQFLSELKITYGEFLLKNFTISNNLLIESYQKSMNQTFYYDKVPFTYEYQSIQQNSINPSSYLDNNLFKSVDSLKISNLYFIKSEFGFGKTSLANNIVKILHAKEVITLYLPIVSLSTDAFSNYSVFAKESLKKTMPWLLDSYDESDPAFGLLTQFFKQILSTPNKIVVILDGLDEHHFCYKLNKLKILFHTLNHMACNIVITVRTEFYNERHLDIMNAIPKPSKKIHLVDLLEWNDFDILEYINLINEKSEYIDSFRSKVEKGLYHEYYGDIPKRPLFLKMLISDLAEEENINNIAMLYEKYFINKFQIDQSGYLSKPLNRPISGKGGFIDHANSLLDCTSEIASIMINYDDISLKEFTDENEILPILLKFKYKSVIELTQNSVLVPFNMKSFKQYKLKFAHKSFQEFFLARFLYKNIKSKTLESKYNIEFPNSVLKFFSAHVEVSKSKIEILDKEYKIVNQLKNAL